MKAMREIKKQIFGYVRVSSTDQNEDRQMIALHDILSARHRGNYAGENRTDVKDRYSKNDS